MLTILELYFWSFLSLTELLRIPKTQALSSTSFLTMQQEKNYISNTLMNWYKTEDSYMIAYA